MFPFSVWLSLKKAGNLGESFLFASFFLRPIIYLALTCARLFYGFAAESVVFFASIQPFLPPLCQDASRQYCFPLQSVSAHLQGSAVVDVLEPNT